MIVDALRVVGTPLTNKVMAGELSRIAVRAVRQRPPEPRKAGTGTLVYPFDPHLGWAAVTYARTPTRVAWDLYRSAAPRLEPLYDELVDDIAGDARGWLRDGETISVTAGNVDRFAAGERQIVGTVKNAIVDGCARRGVRVTVDPDDPDVHVVARLDDDGAMIVCVDLGGGSVSQRGWRIDHGAAPLREHLAAVLLMLGRYDPRADVLVDPMCGSGTIPIEAALMARGAPRLVRGVPPGLSRPAFDAVPGARAAGAPPPLFPPQGGAGPVIVGADRELEALVAAKANAGRAGVTGQIVWQRADVAHLDPDDIAAIAADAGRDARAGLILSNPPYGERLDAADLRVFYGALGDACRRFRGWRGGFLIAGDVATVEFERSFGLRPAVKKPLSNGNLRGYFFGYELS